MKQQEKEIGKSTCIDFQTDVEPKPDGMDQLVESDKSLISFNYQKSRLITTYNHDIWDKPVTGLAYLPGYDGMNNTTKTQLGGDLSAVSDLLLGRTAEISVFFLYNEKMEVATILKGGKKNE